MKKLGKQLLCLALTFVLCLTLIPVAPEAEAAMPGSGTCGENLKWVLDRDGHMTISGTGAMFDYDNNNLPPWENRGSITTLTVEEGVTHLGNYAFLNMPGLTAVSLPDSLKSIGLGSFKQCPALTGVRLPQGVELDENSFSGCSAIHTAGPYGSGSDFEFWWTSEIPHHAFFEMDGLKTVTLPKKLKTIGYKAFEGCVALNKLVLPATVKSIGFECFYNCESLVTVGPVGSGCNLEFSWKNKIPAEAFTGNNMLSGLTVPEGITSIGKQAFFGCGRLVSIKLPDSLKTIGSNAFRGAIIEELCLPAGLTDIAAGAFNGCSYLKNVYFAGTKAQWKNIQIGKRNKPLLSAELHYKAEPLDAPQLTVVQNGSGKPVLSWSEVPGAQSYQVYRSKSTVPQFFKRIKTLTETSFTNSKAEPFETYYYMVRAVSAESTPGMFSAMSTVEKLDWPNVTVELNEDGKPTLTWTPVYGAVKYQVYRSETELNYKRVATVTETSYINAKAKAGKTYYYKVRALSENNNYGAFSYRVSVQVPEKPEPVTTSGECGKDLKWTLSNGTLTVSGKGKMFNYSQTDPAPWGKEVNKLKVDKGVTAIGDCAFLGCSALKSVSLPESLKSIGKGAFNGCSALTEIALPAAVTELGAGAFNGCKALTAITVPEGVTELNDALFNECSALESVTLPAGLQSIGYDAFCSCWALKTVALPEGLKRLGPAAFEDCTALTEIRLPESLEEMGNEVFHDCVALTDVKLPSKVEKVGSGLFSACIALKSVEIPSGWTETRPSMFEGCAALENVKLPDGVTKIGAGSFLGCSSLRQVRLPESVTYIDDDAFYECTALTGVNIPSGVSYLGSNIFFKCRSLVSIAIPQGVTTIKWGSFYECKALKCIEIPLSVKSVADSAFKDCTALEDVYYGGTPEQWQAIDIQALNTGLTYYYLVIHYGQRMPGWPGLTGALNSKGKPALTWTAVSGAAKYQVYRSKTGAVASYELLGETKKLKYTDAKASTGKTFHYRVRAVMQDGTESPFSYAVELKVKKASAKPAITSQPENVTAAKGETATFTVKATGKNLTYQWQYRTSASGKWKKATAEGNQTATLQVPATAKKNGYQYRCKIKNAAGTVTTEAVTLTVTTAAKPAIKTQPKDVTAAKGETATFTVKATGKDLTYQWQYRTSPSGSWKDCSSKTKGYNTSTLQVEATAKRSGYQYRCIITNSAGKVTTKAVTLTVK